MPITHSRALPAANVALRILIVLNWVAAIPIVSILIASIADEAWTFRALGIAPGSWLAASILGLRAVALLGLIGVPLNAVVLGRLLGIVDSVRGGDPFVAVNALRLREIAWALLALQLIGVAIGLIGKVLSTNEQPIHLNAGFSTAGWLSVLLAFVLATIFAEGTRMRDDLEGTV